jgi:ribonuclease HI
MTEKIVLYIAASVTKNPGPGSWAAVAQYFVNDSLQQETLWDGVVEEQTSARRMEAMGIMMALRRLKMKMHVTIYMESYYVHQCWPRLNEWADNRWMQPRNKGHGVMRLVPLPNADLWAEIYQLLKLHDVQYIHVPVNSNDKPPELRRAERLARKAARQMLV